MMLCLQQLLTQHRFRCKISEQLLQAHTLLFRGHQLISATSGFHSRSWKDAQSY